MKRRTFFSATLSGAAGLQQAIAQSAGEVRKGGIDLLRLMKEELERSKALRIAAEGERPYFIEYAIDDAMGFTVSASLGALLARNATRYRLPSVRVRVGDYKFDNSNHVFSNVYTGTRYDSDRLPIDENEAELRRVLWLATDRAYKTAVEAIGRKRATIRNITQNEALPDFAKAEAVQLVGPGRWAGLDENKLTVLARSVSAVFAGHPEVLSSAVQFQAIDSVRHMVNSEGTVIRVPERLAYVEIRGAAYASDGETVRDASSVCVFETARLPEQKQLEALAGVVARNVKSLASAPAGEAYAGPVLLEGIAGAQLFAEVLGRNLALTRRPVSDPGRGVPFVASELEGRLGSRVLPEFLDVIDDPSLKEWNGQPLFGTIEVDEEGVPAKRLALVEKGKLTAFLLTRQPVKDGPVSNGRARLPGLFGARTAAFTNLLIQSAEGEESGALRARFVEMVKQRGKPYGMLIRKLDFPSTASFDEIRRIASAAAQSGGNTRLTPSPIMAFKVFPDGREELIRGIRFRGMSVRSLRDITAVSRETHILSFLNNGAPLALSGGGASVAPSSVVAPSLLFEDLELERPQDDRPKLPMVPPPPL